MKKLREKCWAKCAAVIVLLIACALTAASGLGIFLLENYRAYEDPTGALARDQILINTTLQKRDDVRSYYEQLYWGIDTYYYEHSFAKENTNFFFRLYDAKGEKILENYWLDDALYSYSDSLTISRDTLQSRTFNGEIFTWNVDRWNEDKGVYEYYNADGELLYTYDEDGGMWDVRNQNWGSWEFDGIHTTVETWVTTTEELKLDCGVAADLHAEDEYTLKLDLITLLLPLRYWLIAFLVIAVLVVLGCLAFLLYAAGHKEGVGGIYLAPWHKIPLDLTAVMVILVAIGLICVMDNLPWGTTDFDIVLSVIAVAAVLGLIVLVLYSLVTLVTRFKAGQWWRNMILYHFGNWIWRGVKKIVCALPLVWKTAVACVVMLIIEIIAIACCWGTGQVAMLTLVKWVVLMPLLILLSLQMRHLQKSGEALAAGDLTVRTDTSKLVLDLKKHGENLNRISDGMNAAVDARIKSERLKTELITNVSHDLKTPLTSIVNYVDLMGHLEGLSPDEAKSYLEVLRRQSGKLKKLTEDLVEASKASSGAMPVHPAPTNLIELLQQAVGEYEEKLEAGDLQMLTNLPSQCTVVADGRLLWRVLDNLLNNCCKYAMPGTRVYLTVTAGQSRAAIFVKNVSREVLNIDPQTLMERFVRADASRSTEGSGLGLSIARSLTELQHGTFNIGIDGDLFKVELTLPLAPHVDTPMETE